MISYSQNNEQQIAIDYFRGVVGTVLDIGANDGKTLSNSLAMIEHGWGGVLVEPSKKSFKQLMKLHKTRSNVQCFNVAVSDARGTMDFFESGEHLKTGDHALLSTLVESETERWKTSGEKFSKVKVEVITVQDLLKLCMAKRFEFVTIDTEGVDYKILSQLNLKELGTRMLIIETNGQDNPLFIAYCMRHGLKLVHRNFENLIFQA